MTALIAGASRTFRPVLAVIALACALPAAAQTLRIDRVEAFTVQETSVPRAQAGATGARRELRFEALGRRFELWIEPHPDLGRLAAAMGSPAEPWRGSLPAHAGSWARLTRLDGHWTGLVFDGVEYFAIELAADVVRFAPGAAGLPADATVIYRLADARVEGVSTEGDALTPDLDVLARSLGEEADTPRTAAALDSTKRLDVGLVLDPEQVDRFGGPESARSNTLARINIVDGLFVNQIGVHLQPDEPVLLGPADTTFTATRAGDLLEQLRDWRGSSSSNQSPRNGLTHLFTGKDLDDNTVGIAYSGSLCASRVSASLSEGRQSMTFDALIAAHEIGHVFGAPHDGDTEGACAAASGGLLMGPSLTPATQLRFSDCSIAEIMKVATTSSCLAPLGAADVAVGGPGAVTLALEQPTSLTLAVRSNGSETATDVRLRVLLPAGVTAMGAGGTAGTICETQPVEVNCAFGDLAPGARRDVDLSLLATQGGGQAEVTVTAGGDALASNDVLRPRVFAAPGADLRLSVVMDAATVTAGTTTTARITLRNDGLAAVDDAVLAVTPDAGLVPQSVLSSTGVSCAVSGGAVTCQPAALAAGATAELQLEVLAQPTTRGVRRLQLALRSEATVDPQPGNNAVAGAVTVSAPAVTPAPVAPASSGGGGGRLDTGLLLALLAIAGWRAASRPREDC